MNLNLNDVIFSVLCACMGVLEDSAEAAEMIIPAYQEPEMAVRAPRKRDVVYYDVEPDVPREGNWETVDLSGERPAVSGFLAFKLIVVCYGPHCVENAHTIRYFMNLDGDGMPRSIMRKAGIWVEGSPLGPTVLHEEEGSLWRKRADLVFSMRVLGEKRYLSPLSDIREVPEVVLHRE